MFNLFDILRDGQGGAALDNLARQYGLTSEQVRRATEALLPAYAMALQNSAQNPAALMQVLAAMASNPAAQAYANPQAAFTPQAERQGADLLSGLFGSPEATRAVAERAAAFTGLGADLMARLLPVMGTMLMGGMAQRAAQGSGPGPANPFAPWLAMMQGAMQGALAGAAQAAPSFRPQPAPAPMAGNPWSDFMAGVFGQAPPPPQPQPAAPANPFEAMMTGFFGGQGAAAPAPPPPAPEATTPEASAAWRQMFQTGHEVQEQYVEGLRKVFDGFGQTGSK